MGNINFQVNHSMHNTSEGQTSSGSDTKLAKTKQLPPFSWLTTIGGSRHLSSPWPEMTQRATSDCSIGCSGSSFSGEGGGEDEDEEDMELRV